MMLESDRLPATIRLYENHPEGNGVNQTMLLDMMEILRETGAPWELVFLPEYFPTGPVEDLPNPFNQPLTWHGVSLAEGLKALAVSYRYTHNETGPFGSLLS